MTRGLRMLIMALGVMIGLAIFGGPAAAGALDVLSPWDVRYYAAAFEATARGDFEAADDQLSKVKDDSLVGAVRYGKLMHPTAFRANYDDLSAWLDEYGETAGAERIYALALKRKPAGAEPKAPSFLEASKTWSRIEVAAGRISPDKGQMARDAYYRGDVKRALELAPAAGERWIAGLAAYRLTRFDEAQAYFETLAKDEAEDEWLRSAAAFWAARASTDLGQPERAQGFLRMAAEAPHTFYGMIAERSLGLRTAASGAMEVSWSNVGEIVPAGGAVDVAALRKLIKSDPRAHRAAALTQLGRVNEAGQELRAGLTLAKGAKQRDAWMGLILALNAPLTSGADAAPTATITKATRRASRPEEYPVPELYPYGGFTLDKALVYAMVRQESRFNPYAVSGAGAVGLMQVMPAAAARAAGDDSLLTNVMPLFDAPTNLRIGQDYFTWIMERGLKTTDLLRAIAAYNGGTGTLQKTLERVGPDADSLLLIESLPARETRDYVERVMAAYWTYKRLFGDETKSLDALAAGAKVADFTLDR